MPTPILAGQRNNIVLIGKILYMGETRKMFDCDEGALRAPSSQSNMSFKNAG
jgi:hypothetical protein